MTRWRRRLKYWLSQRSRAASLREEMQFHLDEEIRELREAGMREDDARSEAHRRFGNVTRKLEDSRGVWIARWISDLAQDLAFAARTFRRQPGFAAAAILSAALGVGACSTIFAVVGFIMFQKLPVETPSRLISITGVDLQRGLIGATVSYPDLQDIQRLKSFQGVAGYDLYLAAGIGSRNQEPQRYWGQLVTANYFDVVRPAFVLGRGFESPQDDVVGAPPMAVLSYKLWRDRFAGDPQLAGKSIELNGRKVTVAGVIAAGFHGTEPALAADFWIPFSMMNEVHDNGDMPALMGRRFANWLYAVGRLKRGVDPAMAAAELKALGDRRVSVYPEADPNRRFSMERAGQVNAGMRHKILPLLILTLAVAGLVLLTACANVANLLLARNSARGREIATRLAIGAGRGRLLRQLLAESVLLALAGGLGGCLLALAGTAAIARLNFPFPVPLDTGVRLDAPVLWFCLGISIATGILFGALPALRATRSGPAHSLKGARDAGGLRRFGLRNLLAVAQVAICALLMICVGLFLRSLEASRQVDTGMHNRNVFLLGFDPTLSTRNIPESERLMQRVLERAEALPGVQSASITTIMPLSLMGNGTVVNRSRRPDGWVHADQVAIAPGFFQTLGIGFLAGADFRPGIGANKDSAIINQALAAQVFPNQNPVGQTIVLAEGAGRGRDLRVVGLAATTKSQNYAEEPSGILYLPISEDFDSLQTPVGVTLIAKTAGNPAIFAAPLRDAVHAEDPSLAVFDQQTMEQHLDRALTLPRAAAALFEISAGMGLLITLIGIYGVISFAVAQRTREIGVRMALGARRGQVLAMVLRHGAGLAMAGCMLGAAAALGFSRLAASLLYGVSPGDPLTFVAAPLLLIAMALAACLPPAVRAASLDPSRTLRWE